jgi:hypothetical protein
MKEKADAPIEKEAPTEEALTLDEFCTRLSKTDRRVELIGGFHFDERRAERFKDTESAYRSRFEAFANKPA